MPKPLRESRSRRFPDLLADDRRLHVMLGSPWLTALGATMADDSAGKVWHRGSPFAEGDLLLTVLDSTPRTILCLEVALSAAPPRTDAFHVDLLRRFTPVILATDIEEVVGADFPALGPVPRDLALSILDALDAHARHSQGHRIQRGTDCSSLTSGERAVALSESDGRCTACEREYGGVLGRHGLSALDVHVQENVDRDTGEATPTPVVLCAGCHRIVHSAADDDDSNLELSPYAELRYAWRPECPACGLKRAMPVIWGMTFEEPPDDVVTGGCDFPENPEQWVCRACGEAWSDTLPFDSFDVGDGTGLGREGDSLQVPSRENE